MKKKNELKNDHFRGPFGDMPNYYSFTITQKDVMDAINEMNDEYVPKGIDKNYPLARCASHIIYTYYDHYDMYNKKWGHFENEKWNWDEK
jgi:hypothetical protein